MSTVTEQIDGLIENHCGQHAVYCRERARVALAEMSGMADPGVIKEVEESLTAVYRLLYESSERLAAISAELADVSGELDHA